MQEADHSWYSIYDTPLHLVRTQCWRCRCLYLRTLWRNNSSSRDYRGLVYKCESSRRIPMSHLHSNSFQGIHICPLLIHDWSKKYPAPPLKRPLRSRFWGLEVYYLTQSWKTLGQNLDTYRHISFPSLSLLWYFNGANGTIQSNSQSRRCQEQKDQHGNHGERTSTVDCTDSEIVGENSWLVGASSLLIERATATEQINTQASSLEDLLINYIPVYFSCWLKSNALTKQMRTTFWTAQKRWNVWLTLLKIWADQKMKQTRWNVWQDLNLWILDVFLENRCQASVFLRERAQVEGTESLPRKPSGSHLQTFPFLPQQHSSV